MLYIILALIPVVAVAIAAKLLINSLDNEVASLKATIDEYENDSNQSKGPDYLNGTW